MTVEYDGTEFHGFQEQRAEVRTVQGTLQVAIGQLTGERAVVAGAGRTDAGVHALGQVIHFDTASAIPVERWPHALNSALPPDVAVVAASLAPPGFHARYSAVRKVYRYTIVDRPQRSPLWRRQAHWIGASLDAAAMAEAAAYLLGRRDFTAFAGAGRPVRSAVRTLYELTVRRARERIDVTAAADGFLYRMARSIVGCLIEVGLGRWEPDRVARVLESRQRAAVATTAPACGLCLVRVEYPKGAD